MKITKKIKNNYFAKCKYLKYVEKLPIDNNIILLESQQGKEFGGNMYYLIKELLNDTKYNTFKIYLAVKKNKIEEAQQFYKDKGLNNVNFVKSYSYAYYKLMATAKYLMNDNTFLPFFIKKEGQVYLNTWHGTPLKSLGRKINNDLHNIGNTQKNFIASDFLLYPNEYTKEHMIEDYMIENLCSNTYLLEGYPRNTAFFDDDLKNKIKKEFDLNDKKIIAYMPTWRGTLSRKSNPIIQANINYILEEFEENLKDDQILYVNLHPIESSSVDFSIYKKIKPFPKKYETYEFLNIADVLVTDYSSVFFDFLNTRNKIILYTYDKEDYLSSRGVYRELESFPFPIVETMEDVIKEINKPKEYDDTELIQEFCKYDCKDSSKHILERVIFGNKDNIVEGKIANNQKENVFLFAGRLASNGITTSLKNLLNNVNTDEKNYYILFNANAVKKNLETLREFNDVVNYYSIKGMMNLNICKKILFKAYSYKWISTETYMKKMESAYKYELKRIFADAKVDSIIHFTGYGAKTINLYSQFSGNNAIYVHANMQEEINLRSNQRLDAIKYAYNKYDRVAVVTEDMIEPTYNISKKRDNIHVCRNVIDYKSILEKSKYDLELDSNTVVYPSEAQLFDILNSNNTKFVNVGRFSPEKGQLRLLNAFAKLQQKYPDTNLIIIGGSSYRNYYSQVVQCIKELEIQDKVVLVKSLSNPFPLVKQCDCSVLTSFAEGFGLVLAEADVLNIATFSVDIPGPKKFMEKHGGTLVENSEDGIYQGLEDFVNGKIHPMGVDYKEYNNEALQEFETLFS